MKSIVKHFVEAGKKLFEFSKDAVGVAAQYQDALGYSEKVFGAYAGQVQQWVKDNSEALRIGISDLQVYANDLGTAFSALGLTGADSVKFMEDIISLSADIRAATGKDINEIVGALTRGFTSSTRNLRQFGLFIGEADIKIQALKDGVISFAGDQDALAAAIKKVEDTSKAAQEALDIYTEDSEQFAEAEEKANQAAEELNALLGDQEVSLSSSERTMSLYNLIMERMGFLIGQNSEEARLYNSQLALMKTKFDNLRLAIGNKLLPIFTNLVTKFNEFLGSEQGKELLDQIVELFGTWADNISEMLEDGRFQEFINNLVEQLPTIVEKIGEIVNAIITVTPYLVEGAGKILAFFGVGKEADIDRATKEFVKAKDRVEAFATQQGLSLETAKKAVEGFATENNLKVYQVYQDWDTYEPKMEEYIGKYSKSAETAEEDVKTAMEGMTEDVKKHNNDMGSLEPTGWQVFIAKVESLIERLRTKYQQMLDDMGIDRQEILNDANTTAPMPFAAGGRRTYANHPYIVGDDAQNRPELVIPDTAGEIINGDRTERVLNNINNSRSVGSVNVYLTSYGADANAIANEIGIAVQQKLRMSGAML